MKEVQKGSHVVIKEVQKGSHVVIKEVQKGSHVVIKEVQKGSHVVIKEVQKGSHVVIKEVQKGSHVVIKEVQKGSHMKSAEQDYCFRPRTSTPIDFCMEDEIPHHYLSLSQSNIAENKYEIPRMESLPASPINSRKKSAYMSSQASDKPHNMEGIAVKRCRSRIKQGGVCCEHCNSCLIELKRQALRIMFPGDSGLRMMDKDS
ncbi:hypothetical protein LOTGIDRAFT_154951 [Lottia gigantea]|uniref:Uncharacterized protein n=1 Tax=Lottia gigantea TaxID=225164 RepID=V3Z477_LOTGI|nr:hypothetical protein LOTGIDRAFT_154951 [Lottia gigantea]ESO85458.1 hypothetical protein LOTGIDRAFT_154951 [Lottia gigantea]